MPQPDGTRWWFDAGAISLDFAHTGGFEASPDLLRTTDDLASWFVARFAGLDATCHSRDLTDARALRSAIARLARVTVLDAAPDESDVDIVNLFAATPDIPPVLAGGSRQAGRGRPRFAQALSEISRDTVRVLGEGAAGRIRECAAEDCTLVYLDSSRAGSRRWCSMQRCGNRAKVRAHRARARAVGA
jgi:predicted RNA-binding Zn ribbon-like protein